jgi:hypothetical protein
VKSRGEHQKALMAGRVALASSAAPIRASLMVFSLT